MTEHPAPAPQSVADVSPIPLTAIQTDDARHTSTGGDVVLRRTRVLLPAVIAFAAAFFVVRGLLAPENAPHQVEGELSESASPEHQPSRLSGTDNTRQLPADELFVRTSPAVVKVVVQNRRGRTVGSGSGFVVGSAGLIVTNYHVIEAAHAASIVFADSSTLPAKGVVALDEKADLALLAVADRMSAQPLDLAGHTLPAVGVRVYAIGNPLGLSNTLSDGLISGHREVERVKFLQTTAPISPGSSGGPLIGADGRVVGVTTFLFKGGQNLNFAVHCSHVAKLMLEYEAGGKLTQLPLRNEVRHVEAGNSFLQRGDFARAMKEFDEAIRDDPEDSEAYIGRGWAWRHKNLDNAIRDFGEAIRLDPKSSEAYCGRGTIWSEKLVFDNAIRDFSAAIKLDPNNSAAYRGRGFAWYCKMNYDRSNRDYEEAKRIERDNSSDRKP